MTRVLQVFARAPVPGQCKTRLAPVLGEAGASGLHARLVLRLLGLVTEALPRLGNPRVELWCAPDTAHPFFDRCARHHRLLLRTQQGEDLGQRMYGALDDALGRQGRPVLVGTDCLSITADANTDGVPDRPTASALRAKSVMSYDEQGRVFKSETFSVDPSAGTVSTAALTSNSWFDSRGNTVKTTSPGGVVSKSEFDGPGRMTKSYTTDGGGDSAYADAGNVTGDIVLSQSETTYDIGGRVLLTTSRERFHDETATGPLGTPTTGVKARVSYQANYYDKADRTTASVDVGTNGGTAYTRPATVPARSDTVLVTEYGYNAAGWLETTTDPRGLVGKQYYDAAQRTIKTIENYVDGVVADTDDKTVNYVYASNGQLQKVRAGLTGGGVQETEYVFGVTPAQGSTLTSNEMRYQTKHPDASAGTSSTSEVESGTFNNLGQTLTKTDRNGSVHTYAYDVVGRQISDTVTTLGAGVDASTRRVVPLLVLELSKPDY